MFDQNALSIDFSSATVSGSVYTFPFNVEKSIKAATSITLQNYTASNTVYKAIATYYNVTDNRLMNPLYSGHYFTPDGKTLTYV